MRRLAIVTLGLLWTMPALAAEEGAPYKRCLDQAMSTQAMVECNDQEFKRQDERLNRAYKAALAAQTAARKTQLQQVQRQWLRFRDADCGFLGDPAGGSFARVNAGTCMATLTATRAAELEQLLGP